MGRLLVLLVFVLLFPAFLGVAFRFLRQLAVGSLRAGGGFGNLRPAQAAALPAVEGLVRSFLAASAQPLPKRLEELAALLRAADGAVRQRGVALEPAQLKDVVARAIAAHGVAPDYQVRTLLDFV